MKRSHCVLVLLLAGPLLPVSLAGADEIAEIHADVLADKIQGGLLGEILGNINGLPHELKYNRKPGNVVSYTPALPEGAWTDDDTDIEWVYIYAIEQSGEILLPPRRIMELWEKHINRYIWCANRYARDLMEIGIEPPLTGRIALNPWSVFNISGQFVCEAFGMIAPAMPQTAARVGVHYLHTTVDGEPIQTTQLFDTMIATAFVESDVERIVAAGLAAVDPESEIHRVVSDVRRWVKQNPDDWPKTWHAIKDKYMRYDGNMRDINGHELNTAAIIGSLLYGKGDFVETLRLAFNFGWDADCNAATAASVVGVIKGRRWMDRQGWTIEERYKNVARPGLPTDETITRYGERLVAVARKVILANGGQEVDRDGKKVFRIRTERPANVEPLPKSIDRLDDLRKQLVPQIDRDLTGTPRDRARAAYLALCLNEADRIAKDRPDDWARAIKALNDFPGMVKRIYKAPKPVAEQLQARAEAAGLEKLEDKRK